MKTAKKMNAVPMMKNVKRNVNRSIDTIRLETDSEESEKEMRQDDPDFEPSCSTSTNSKQRNFFNPHVCQVADKYQLSHRALTEIVFADKVNDESSNEVTLSVMTCKR